MLRSIITALLLSLSLLSAAHAAESKTVSLSVENMTCQVCPVTVRKALQKVDGVIEASADLDSKSATVTFDPAKTSVEELMEATADAGYPSSLKP